MSFSSVDGDIDEEERSRGVRVWDSGIVRSEVQVVGCGRGKCGCLRELERQDRVACYFLRDSLHCDGL